MFSTGFPEQDSLHRTRGRHPRQLKITNWIHPVKELLYMGSRMPWRERAH
jgi:hypothetical protein